ncbi:MAG: FKBP-type peptidyl-prolyl cis-trans isomerase [Flavobacteriales bacterium]|nr:FKBP-type peptidyl-prolyl cis-trans isomerase [Flavobacteriales bacterium]
MIACVAGMALMACNQEKEAPALDLNNQVDKVSYSLGVSIGNSLKQQGVTELKPEIIQMAFADVFQDKDLQVNVQDAETALQTYFMDQQRKKGEASAQKGEDFLTKNKTEDGVVTLPSGLQYKVLVEGNGAKPGPEDMVTTHYTGTLLDGTVFDSSVERGQPASFPVNGVIPGWTEALQLMPVGSKWKLWVPANLAYGERGAGGKIGPNETLVFELELLSIQQNPDAGK